MGQKWLTREVSPYGGVVGHGCRSADHVSVYQSDTMAAGMMLHTGPDASAAV